MRNVLSMLSVTILLISGCSVEKSEKYRVTTSVGSYLRGTWERREGYLSGVIDAIHYFDEQGLPPAYIQNCLLDPEAVSSPHDFFLIPATHEARRVPKDKREIISPISSFLKWVTLVCSVEEYGQLNPNTVKATD